MGVDAKRLFFWNHSVPEAISSEQKAYQKWVATSEKRLVEAERKNIYPRYTVTDSNFQSLFEVRKLPDETYVISIISSPAGHPRLDSAVVIQPDQSVHLLDALFVPGHNPKTVWQEQPLTKNKEYLSTLENRLNRARIFDVRTEGRWRGGFQPTSEILSALQTS